MNSHSILDILEDVAERVINPRFGSLDATEIDEKAHANDLVTIADREAELEIAAALSGVYPDAYVLGEEAYATDPTALEHFYGAEHAFTIDPIDGTLNFVDGNPDHAVMLAELRHGDVVRSWIWQPQHRVAFLAERGAGVTRNDTPVVRGSRESGGVRLNTSYQPWQGTELASLGALGPTWMCCGVDYPNLITGDTDLLVYRGKQMPWDHAPGSLMATELGGRVGLWDGTPYRASDPRPSTRPVILLAATSDEYLGAATRVMRDWKAA